MLILSRYINESIVIDDDIIITILSLNGDKTRISIEASKAIEVFTDDIHTRTLQRLEVENKNTGSIEKETLSITCKIGQKFRILDLRGDINITICDIRSKRVRVGVDAPISIDVCLHELHQRKKADLLQKVESYYAQSSQNEMPFEPNISEINSNNIIGKKHILLVEDSAIIRIANCELLKNLGYAVDTASNGRNSIDMMHNPYDLILLDIGLPDITGVEVCQWIRSTPTNLNKLTPVIFLTAYGELMREKCIAVGGNDFAVKPLSKEKLLKLIRQWTVTKQGGEL